MQPSARKRPVVLVVEDETLIRIAAVEAVEEAGFEVIEAQNADEAIAILEQRTDIHLVFTDIQMPGSMDGLKLAHCVRDRWPPVKIIATSGRAPITRNGFAQWRALPAQAVHCGADRGNAARIDARARLIRGLFALHCNLKSAV